MSTHDIILKALATVSTFVMALGFFAAIMEHKPETSRDTLRFIVLLMMLLLVLAAIWPTP